MSDIQTKRKRCAYRSCPTRPPKDTSYFSFPKDREWAIAWLRASNRLDLLNLNNDHLHKNYCLCENHFEEHFISKGATRKTLFSQAIPTKFFHAVSNIEAEKLIKANISDAVDPPLLIPLREQHMESWEVAGWSKNMNSFHIKINPQNLTTNAAPPIEGSMVAQELLNKNSQVCKFCEVPMCKNTSIKTPKKLCVYVPTEEELRQKWLRLARRNELPKSKNFYFCEDHFDMPNEMENYKEYQVTGSVSQIRMRPNCVPTKFFCQLDRKRTLADGSLPTAVKKEKCDDNEESYEVPSGSLESTQSASTSTTPFTSNIESEVKLEIKEELLDPTSLSHLNCNIWNKDKPVIKSESTQYLLTSPTPSNCNIWSVEKVDIKEEFLDSLPTSPSCTNGNIRNEENQF